MDVKAQDLFRHLANHTLIDVRSPVEFAQMHFPYSINAPLLSDEERVQVGTIYKKLGSQKAIELGHQLISGATKTARLDTWEAAIKACRQEGRTAILCCHRGGLRSQLTQAALLHERGLKVGLVVGGIKALRRAALETLQNFPSTSTAKHLTVVTGHTGSGKTQFIERRSRQSLDLEQLANHRGSAFGLVPGTMQPSQATFENRIACRVAELNLISQRGVRIWTEDESRTIGKLVLPAPLFDVMKTAPVFRIHKSRNSRAESLIQLYFEVDFGLGASQCGRLLPSLESSVQRAKRIIFERLAKISAKLGRKETQNLQSLIHEAFDQFESTHDASVHMQWVSRLLECYYDPLYERSIRKDRFFNPLSTALAHPASQ